MLGLRGIGKIVRGKATPFQLVAAAVLGALIGFVPAGAQSAGLYALLLALLVLVNANLLVAALTWAACEALAYVLLPVSFAVGRALLDGPTGPVFALLANAPGTALLGLEYYAAAGGLVLGALIGAGIGALLAWALTRFRRRMAALEAGSEAYRRFANRRWVRALAFVLIGPGHGKTTYAQMLEKRVGNPVRPVGAALVALLVVLGFVVRGFLAEPVVTALRSAASSA